MHRCVMSIAQDMVFGVSERKILTTKHMGLGLTIHQIEETCKPVECSWSLCQLDMIRRMDTSIAKD